MYSAPNKLGRIFKPINGERGKAASCQKACMTVKCAARVVFEVPLNCGQTLAEWGGASTCDSENTSIINKQGSNMVVHCGKCGCSPDLSSCKVLAS